MQRSRNKLSNAPCYPKNKLLTCPLAGSTALQISPHYHGNCELRFQSGKARKMTDEEITSSWTHTYILPKDHDSFHDVISKYKFTGIMKQILISCHETSKLCTECPWVNSESLVSVDKGEIIPPLKYYEAVASSSHPLLSTEHAPNGPVEAPLK